MIRVSLSEEEFKALINGIVIKKPSVEIVLQDMDVDVMCEAFYEMMLKYARNSGVVISDSILKDIFGAISPIVDKAVQKPENN